LFEKIKILILILIKLPDKNFNFNFYDKTSSLRSSFYLARFARSKRQIKNLIKILMLTPMVDCNIGREKSGFRSVEGV